jgi:ubiquinone/menaquinone biosynthesis C-methylase UbiE
VSSVAGVSFDRAAGYYDATRSLPERVRDELADVLAAELDGRGRCLEIGVGTGRIALPLDRRGIPLVGTDIAPAMLERLIANAGGRRFPVLLADATGLPLADGSFGAVIASHVLHLIPDWRSAVDEAARVMRPGGVLLADFGGGPRAPWSGPSRELMRRRRIEHLRPGVSDRSDVADHLAGRASARALPPVAMTVRRSLRQDLDDWQRQIHAWTWAYSPGDMRAACLDIRDWAAGHGWPLDREVELERSIQWWAFQLNG